MSNRLHDFLGAWVDLCEHRPVPVLLLVVVVTGLCALVVWRHAAIDSDLGKLIRPSDAADWYEQNEEYKRAFPDLQQTAVVVVSGADGGAVDRSARALAQAFTDSGAFDFVFAPALDPSLRALRLFYLDEADLAQWVRGVQYDYGALLRLSDSAGLANAAFTLADHVQATNGQRLPSVLASIADAFSTDGSIAMRLRDGLGAYPHLQPRGAERAYTLIVLKGPQRLDESLPNAELVRRIRGLMRTVERPASVDVRLTGEIPLANEEIGAALDGIGIAGALSLVLLAVILGVGVRSARVIACIFALLGVGVAWTLAFATVAVGSFNTLSLIFVVMFFGLGVDFAVHFALRMRESRRIVARDDEAEIHAAREIGPALLLCMLTSSIAFLSFAPTDYRGLAELGIICAGGMVIAFGLTLSLIPALFTVLRIPVQRTGDTLLWLHRLPLPPRGVLLVTALLALGAGLLARNLSFDYSVLAMRDASTEAMSTLLELQENGISTDYSIAVLADDAAAARRLKSRLERLPEVGDVLIPDDLVPEGQASKRALLDPLASLVGTIDEVLPGTMGEHLPEAIDYLAEAGDAVAAGDRRIYQTFIDGLNRLRGKPDEQAVLDDALHKGLQKELADLKALLAARPFSLAELPVDLRARFIDGEGRHLVTVQPAEPVASRAATEAFIDAVASVSEGYAGRAVVEWGVGEVAVKSFVEAVTLAVACIAVVLVLHFRGLVLPIMVLVPLALTTLFTFALMVLFGIDLNMANILVVPLIFGLGVDTGIHVVHRFQAAGSVAAVFGSSTARAVLISALTTIGTFFSLSFSPHKGAASVGLLLTIAISVMLLATFIVLPALLELRHQRSGAGGTGG